MKLEHQIPWSDYELIDSGNFEKLERFGPYILIRPEPQALWSATLSDKEWKNLAHAHFNREQKDKFRMTDDLKGGWTKLKDLPDSWNIRFRHKDINLTLRIALTGFGHVGIFPEQSSNWAFIDQCIRSWKFSHPTILNLFAYTGAASMVARSAGADVVHVDGARPSINWANQNMALNNLEDIRWIFEDAFKFVKREVRRGKKYNGIIMDPPPYGRGSQGERWVLQEHLNDFVGECSQLLEKENSFFILSMYAVSLSSLTGKFLANHHFQVEEPEFGEFCLKATRGTDLPMGTFMRFKR